MAIVETAMLDPPADMVTVADFDRDGADEYVIGRRDDRELSVFSNVFNEEQRRAAISLDSLPVALSNGDFDGDGIPELAVAVTDARLEFLTSDRGLNFSLTRTVALPSRAFALDVRRVGARVALVVATGACVHVVDLYESAVAGPIVTDSVGAAAVRLESLRQRRALAGIDAPDVTVREREVVRLALQGLTARQIGAKLFITDRTVETHLARAYAKLGVRSRFELIARVAETVPRGQTA